MSNISVLSFKSILLSFRQPVLLSDPESFTSFTFHIVHIISIHSAWERTKAEEEESGTVLISNYGNIIVVSLPLTQTTAFAYDDR